jgi:HAE1 family hydrophobic/amphiphilic exporter-1
MRIWIKPDRLAHLGITVPEIMDAIRAQSVVVPGGKFGAEPAPPGTEFTYTVRMPDRWLQSEEGVRRNRDQDPKNGSQVKIKHIARVELGVETYNAFTRFERAVCAMIALYQAPGPMPWIWPSRSKPPWKSWPASFPRRHQDMIFPWIPPCPLRPGSMRSSKPCLSPWRW